MNHSRRRPHLIALIIATLACVGLLSLSSAPAWAAAGIINEFPLPTKGALAAGPDGNLWFTEFKAGQIGRISLQ